MGTRHLRALAVLSAVLGLGLVHGCAGTPNGGPSTSPAPATSSSGGTVSTPATPVTPGSPGTPSPGGLSLPPTKPGASSAEISLHGTVEAGVERGCLLLHDRGGLYLLLNGDPAVVYAGASVQITGHIVKDIRTFCMQGVPFQVTSARTG